MSAHKPIKTRTPGAPVLGARRPRLVLVRADPTRADAAPRRPELSPDVEAMLRAQVQRGCVRRAVRGDDEPEAA